MNLFKILNMYFFLEFNINNLKVEFKIYIIVLQWHII